MTQEDVEMYIDNARMELDSPMLSPSERAEARERLRHLLARRGRMRR